MKRILLSLLVVSSLLFGQEESIKPYELSFTIGGTIPEDNLNLEDHENYGVRLGTPNNVILPNVFDMFEFIFERTNEVDYENSNLNTDINRFSINLIHNYKKFKTVTPYLLFGIGYEDFGNEYLNTNDSITNNLGAGIKYHLNDDWDLRAEVRDHINLESKKEHELIYTFGLTYKFGSKAVKTMVKKEEPKQKQKVIEKKVPKNIEKPIEQKQIPLDSDKDSVVDSKDLCPKTLEGFKVDTVGCPIDYNFKVQFDTDKYNVKQQYIQTLKKFVDFMNMRPKYQVDIKGHTDWIGSNKYNDILSTKRAKSVMNKLVELGVDANRLSYKGFGEDNPIASNETKEGRAQNRRVEAVIKK